MTIFAWIVIITTIAGVGGTGLGGVVGALFKKDSSRIVSLLLSFAAGIMLSIVCFDLIAGAIEPENSAEPMSIFLVIAGTMFAFVLVFLLNFWIDRATNHEVKHIDKSHPQTADDLDELIHADHYEEHKKLNSSYQLFIGGVVMALAIALHNLPEGMVIGASYATDAAASALTGSGLITAIVIGLHNIPEGMAVSVPLIAGGMKRLKAILITALSGAPTIIGAMIGYSIGLIGPLALSISLSLASGAMLYVVFGELLPESILMYRSKTPAFAVLVGMMTGLLIIFA